MLHVASFDEMGQNFTHTNTAHINIHTQWGTLVWKIQKFPFACKKKMFSTKWTRDPLCTLKLRNWWERAFQNQVSPIFTETFRPHFGVNLTELLEIQTNIIKWRKRSTFIISMSAGLVTITYTQTCHLRTCFANPKWEGRICYIST